MHRTSSTVAHSEGFLGLFARYILGEISENTWQTITAILDDADLSTDEREAVACYLNEHLANSHTAVGKPWNRKMTVGEWGAPAHG